MNQATTKQKIFLLSFALVILLSIEGISYLSYSPTRLDQIKEILEPHPNRFWRGKPNYRGTFFGAAVEHNDFGMRAKDMTPTDILVLGGSPSYGWGVPFEKTYSHLISEKLKKKVINASMVGYSSFQGKKLLKEIFSTYRPKLVTISYVINDVDHYRFFRNQVEGDSKVPKEQSNGLITSIGNLYTLKLLQSLLAKSQERLPVPNNIRVNSKEYRQNLLEMINFIKNNGAEVLLVKFPVNLPSKLDDPEVVKLLPKNCDIKSLPTREFYYCAKKQKMNDNDLRKLMAINSSLKAKSYNQIMQELGDELGIKVADATKAFQNTSDYLFIDPKLDPIHPNEKGHRVLAETIVESLETDPLPW